MSEFYTGQQRQTDGTNMQIKMHSTAHRQAAYDGAAEFQAAALQMGVGNKLWPVYAERDCRLFGDVLGNRLTTDALGKSGDLGRFFEELVRAHLQRNLLWGSFRCREGFLRNVQELIRSDR